MASYVLLGMKCSLWCVFRKKKHRKPEELKQLQAKEVMTAGESVEHISKATSDSSKKTKAEMAFQKSKEERVTDQEVSMLMYSTISIAVSFSCPSSFFVNMFTESQL